MADLVMTGLTKRFGGVTAVEDLTVAVGSGELVTLVGPSGCGKTTTLRLIAGFDFPNRGEIVLDGRSLKSLPPEERGIGIVFQHYALFPHMNVFENIAYGLKFTRTRVDKRRRVDELLELVGLTELRDRRPSELSAGQQQRVALSRALAPYPKVLLLDEPLSALDVQLRERLRLEIRQIQREFGITTLYVTHDQEEALAISDRVGVMNEGRLEQIGAPWEVYHEPASRFVAGFVGRGNLVEGTVAGVDRGEVEIGLEDEQSVVLQGEVDPARDRAGDLRPGQRVSFLVRPEHLFVGEDGPNPLEGKLVMKEYLGDAVLLHVKSGCQMWVVKIGDPGREWLEREGERVVLGFSPSNGRIYTQEPG